MLFHGRLLVCNKFFGIYNLFIHCVPVIVSIFKKFFFWRIDVKKIDSINFFLCRTVSFGRIYNNTLSPI